MLVRDPQQRLHFLGRGGRYGGGRGMLSFVPGRVDVEVGLAVLVTGENPVLAHHGGESLQRLVEGGRRSAWRKDQAHVRQMLQGRACANGTPARAGS
jgi:hypothetical protein